MPVTPYSAGDSSTDSVPTSSRFTPYVGETPTSSRFTPYVGETPTSFESGKTKLDPKYGGYDKPEVAAAYKGYGGPTAYAGSFARGASPMTAGALLGGAAGSVFGPGGAAGGAATGILAMAGTELALNTYNAFAGVTGLPKAMTPQEATDKLLDLAGVDRPKTDADLAFQALGGGLAGGASLPIAAKELASQVANPVARGVLRTMGENPAAQTMAGASSALSADVARRAGGGPVTQTLAGLVGGLVPGSVELGVGLAAPKAPTLLDELPPAQQQAVVKIADRLQTDYEGGGAHPVNVLARLGADRAQGVPSTLSDVGGVNVGKLSGAVARAPGESSQIATTSLEGRLQGAGERLTKNVESYIAEGPTTRQSAELLSTDQRTNSRPLYDKAFEPGSVAPLEKQFEDVFNESSKAVRDAENEHRAAERQLTQALAAESRAGEDVYLNNSALAAKRDAELTMQAAEQKLNAARTTHEDNLANLRQAQDAVTNGERGGIYSPRVRQFLRDPLLQEGVKRGIEIQRIESLTNNTPMKLADYAVNEQGEVVSTPNMRLLDAGKRGLDAILEDYRNPTTGKLVLDERGRAIEGMRKAYVAELDRLNPDYAGARAAWAGPARAKTVMKTGENILGMHPEDVQSFYSELTPGEQKHFKIGVAQALKDAIAEGSVTSPTVRKLSASSFDSMMKQRFKPLFKNDAQFNDFIDAVTGERRILESHTKYKGGSQSAERLADESASDKRTADLAAAASHAYHGNWISAAKKLLETKRQLGLVNNAEANAETARLLFDSNFDLNSPAGRALTELLEKNNAPPSKPQLAPAAPAAYSAPGAILGTMGVSQ